jgi:hypothetical protein
MDRIGAYKLSAHLGEISMPLRRVNWNVNGENVWYRWWAAVKFNVGG